MAGVIPPLAYFFVSHVILKIMNKEIFKRILLWLGTGTLLVGIFLVMYFFAWRDKENNNSEQYQIEITESDWKKGNPNAPVVLVEYSDFQCPACAYYALMVSKLISEYPDKTLFVYRHFPLASIHKNAHLASYAAEAAGKQDKFWEMYEKIFANQNVWSNNNQAKEIFLDYAKELGLDENKFSLDITSPDVKNKVFQDYQSAILYQLNATPSFFLNGKKIQPPRTLEEFKLILEQELRI
jgi:protein-disulfide isomerase